MSFDIRSYMSDENKIEILQLSSENKSDKNNILEYSLDVNFDSIFAKESKEDINYTNNTVPITYSDCNKNLNKKCCYNEKEINQLNFVGNNLDNPIDDTFSNLFSIQGLNTGSSNIKKDNDIKFNTKNNLNKDINNNICKNNLSDTIKSIKINKNINNTYNINNFANNKNLNLQYNVYNKCSNNLNQINLCKNNYNYSYNNNNQCCNNFFFNENNKYLCNNVNKLCNINNNHYFNNNYFENSLIKKVSDHIFYTNNAIELFNPIYLINNNENVGIVNKINNINVNSNQYIYLLNYLKLFEHFSKINLVQIFAKLEPFIPYIYNNIYLFEFLLNLIPYLLIVLRIKLIKILNYYLINTYSNKNYIKNNLYYSLDKECKIKSNNLKIIKALINSVIIENNINEQINFVRFFVCNLNKTSLDNEEINLIAIMLNYFKFESIKDIVKYLEINFVNLSNKKVSNNIYLVYILALNNYNNYYNKSLNKLSFLNIVINNLSKIIVNQYGSNILSLILEKWEINLTEKLIKYIQKGLILYQANKHSSHIIHRVLDLITNKKTFCDNIILYSLQKLDIFVKNKYFFKVLIRLIENNSKHYLNLILLKMIDYELILHSNFIKRIKTIKNLINETLKNID